MFQNPVTKLFSSMTDAELSQAISEMKEDGLKGIIRENGIVREKARAVHEIAGGSVYEHLMMVQFSILQAAAYRFTPTVAELTFINKPYAK